MKVILLTLVAMITCACTTNVANVTELVAEAGADAMHANDAAMEAATDAPVLLYSCTDAGTDALVPELPPNGAGKCTIDDTVCSCPGGAWSMACFEQQNVDGCFPMRTVGDWVYFCCCDCRVVDGGSAGSSIECPAYLDDAGRPTSCQNY